MNKKELIRTIDPDALWVLCQEFDRLVGGYPKHMYEGAAVFSFFVEVLKEKFEEKKESIKAADSEAKEE